MTTFIEAIKVNDLKNGEMKAVVLEGHEILLTRLNDKYYATNNRCPHFGGKLSQGKLEGTVVTCPVHGSQFDLTSGKVVRWLKGSGLLSSMGKALKGPRDLTSYRVKEEKERVLVEL
jgi:3-phenylpropionate/trans-cinnamate dioxygenase ferredoxin subunit